MILVFLMGASPHAFAQSNSTISYQGRLTDAAGKNVPDGNQSVTFKIFDGSGTSSWSETQSVAVIGGVFTVLLGKNVPLPSPFPSNAELEITVANTTFSPRTKFSSAPYALGVSGGYVGALNLNGHILGGNGDTVSITSGSNVAFKFTGTKGVTIEAGGNPSTITGVQAGKYLVGGGTSGVVTVGVVIPLEIHEDIPNQLVSLANDGIGRIFSVSAHGNCAGGFFETVGPGNANTTLQITNNGTGKGAFIEATNLSTGTALAVSQAGTGITAMFNSDNAANTSSVIDLKNAGMGKALSIQQINATANNNAVEVQNAGIGVAGRFVSSNKTADAAALEGESQGTGAAIHGFNPGKGRAALFESYSGSTTVPTVEIQSKGEPGNGLFVKKTGDGGSAGYFWNSKVTNTTDALFALTDGSGAAVSGNGGAVGSAGRFLIDTLINKNNCVNVSTKGSGDGGHFTIDNPNSTANAIFGETNGEGVGMFGSSTHDNGTGVIGIANKPQSIGVSGTTTNGLSGVSGFNGKEGDGVTGLSTLGVGVNGKSNGSGPSSDGVLGNSTASQAAGVHGIETKADAYGVHGFNAVGYGVYGETVSGTGVCAYGGSSGIAINVNGKFIQSGGVFQASPTSTVWTTNKPATVKLNNGKKIKLFAEEATEVFFNDYGAGALQNGRAHITLDKNFLETVTIDEAHPLKVFIQLEGDCNGVYVANKTNTGFDVAELKGGLSNSPFTYRIVCKRKYYEDERLATEAEDVTYNTRMLKKAWPEEVTNQNSMATQIQSRN